MIRKVGKYRRNFNHENGTEFSWQWFKIADVCPTNKSLLFIETTKTNMNIHIQTTVESQSGVVWHTDVVKINVLSVGEFIYSITFIYEASRYVKSCHIKTKGEAD